MYKDRLMICNDCGKTFIFSADAQEHFAQEGFSEDSIVCKECLTIIQNNRKYFKTTCACCGTEAHVPFQPREDRPVYCNDCYTKYFKNNVNAE